MTFNKKVLAIFWRRLAERGLSSDMDEPWSDAKKEVVLDFIEENRSITKTIFAGLFGKGRAWVHTKLNSRPRREKSLVQKVQTERKKVGRGHVRDEDLTFGSDDYGGMY
jgi:hypothetical protein